MTDPPIPSPLSAIDANEPTRRRNWIPLVVITTVVLVIVAAGGVATLMTRSSSERAAWDPILEPYVSIVERDRGLDFDRPVNVVYLDEAAFETRLAQGIDDLDDDDLAELERSFASMRALGLVAGEYDLERLTQGSAGAVAAFFDPDTDEIVVPANYRTAELDPYQESVLIHEMTHALQDQHFDLDAIWESDDEHDTIAGDVLVEGDASAIQAMFLSSLDAAAFDAYLDAQSEAVDTATSAIEEFYLPPAFKFVLQVPYVVGPSLAWMLRGRGGLDELNRAFEHPPITDRDALNPYVYVYGNAGALRVTEPKASNGATNPESGVFGSMMLMALLNVGLDPLDAINAADGWGGDHYVMYDDAAGAACIEVAVRGIDDAATGAIEHGLALWVGTVPGATVVSMTAPDGARQVNVHSCDPGSSANPNLKSTDDLLLLLSARGQLFTNMMLAPDASSNTMWCVTDAAFRALTPAELRELATTSDESSPVVARAQQVILEAMGTCPR